MSLSAMRCRPNGSANPAVGRPNRGVRHRTSSATKETTNAAAAPISASVKGSGSSVAVPIPCVGRGTPAITCALSGRRADSVGALRATLGGLRSELVLVDEGRQLGVVRALQPNLLAPRTRDHLGRQA